MAAGRSSIVFRPNCCICNFKGLREFKEWFHPEWEPMYLLSPGGVKRPLILANIARLVSGGVTDVFRR